MFKTIPTLNSAILDYLKQNKKWCFGGTLERSVGDRMRSKNSVVGVRLRELSRDDGPLEKRFVENPKGRGARVIQYRMKSKKLAHA